MYIGINPNQPLTTDKKMITTLLIIATILLAITGLAIITLCKALREAATTSKDRVIRLKKESYDNYQMFLDEVACHDIALQEVDELKESLAQVKPHKSVIDAYEEEAQALREEAREAARDAAEFDLQSEEILVLKRKLSTVENNLNWLSSYADKTRSRNRKLKLELSCTRAKLKYLEVTDGYFTLRTYKSESYSKIYVVGHGYLKAPLTEGWPYLLKNGDFVACGDLIKELREQITAVRAASFGGVK